MPRARKAVQGRPPRAGKAATKLLRVRVTPQELKTYEAAAQADGQSVSGWVRVRLAVVRCDKCRRWVGATSGITGVGDETFCWDCRPKITDRSPDR